MTTPSGKREEGKMKGIVMVNQLCRPCNNPLHAHVEWRLLIYISFKGRILQEDLFSATPDVKTDDRHMVSLRGQSP